jgi:hypothetical protein
MKKRRSFWQYIKDQGVWMYIAIVAISLLIGIPSLTAGAYWMAAFVFGIPLGLMISSYVDWVKKG